MNETLNLFKIRIANVNDVNQIRSIDHHLNKETILDAVTQKRVIVVCFEKRLIGVLRFSLFWDIIPMINFIYLNEPYRHQGLGAKLHDFFENEMRKQKHQKLMTTTQEDESGQFFFRKLGYKDAGSFSYPHQADELIMFKDL